MSWCCDRTASFATLFTPFRPTAKGHTVIRYSGDWDERSLLTKMFRWRRTLSGSPRAGYSRHRNQPVGQVCRLIQVSCQGVPNTSVSCCCRRCFSAGLRSVSRLWDVLLLCLLQPVDIRRYACVRAGNTSSNSRLLQLIIMAAAIRSMIRCQSLVDLCSASH